MMVYAIFGVLVFCMAAWFVFAALKALEIILRRVFEGEDLSYCLLYTSPSPRD